MESQKNLLFGISFSKPLISDSNGVFFSINFYTHIMYDNIETVSMFNITNVDSTYKELTGNNQYFIIPVDFIAINRLRMIEIASDYDILLDIKDTRYTNIVLPTELTIGDYVAVTSKLTLDTTFNEIGWIGTYKFGLTNAGPLDNMMTPVTLEVVAGNIAIDAMLYNIKTEFVKTAYVKKDITYPVFNLVCDVNPNVSSGLTLFVDYILNTYKYSPETTITTLASNNSLSIVVPVVANDTGEYITGDYITDTSGSFIIMNSTAKFETI